MLSVLETMYLFFFVFIVFVDNILRKYEDHLPALSKCFKFGNFRYRGDGARFLNVIEIPKSLYSHFYVTAMVSGVTILIYAVRVYFLNFQVHRFLYSMLYFLCYKNEPSVSVAAALLTLLLVIIQTSRRYYETRHLQVFSKSVKMNVFHYILAQVHYSGLVLAAVGEAPLFCGDQNRDKINWIDFRTAVLALPCIVVFTYAWIEQYKSNIILSNLRRDKKTEEVVTEEYRIPVGRLFNHVSSPHRLCEIVIYLVYFLVTPTRTFFLIFLWVFSNQVLCALYTNDWYKSTFKDFPKDKKAIIPAIL